MSFIRNYGIEQSIYEKCHHNITYGTLDFNVPLPPPYYREIWDYKNADTESIQKAISNFDWPKAFRNKNANESCKLLTDTLMNIFRNYIPHKTKKFDCKTPDWMNTLIISALKKRSILVKRYYRNPSEYNKETLINQSNECTKLIIEAKQNYIAKMSSKLDCADTTLSTYWAIINRFLNKKKIPNIPPLLVNNKLVSDFHKKAELFNRHFAEQCTLVQNTSTLPVFNFKTNNRLKSFDINKNELYLIIKNLNANKATIRMIYLFE